MESALRAAYVDPISKIMMVVGHAPVIQINNDLAFIQSTMRSGEAMNYSG